MQEWSLDQNRNVLRELIFSLEERLLNSARWTFKSEKIAQWIQDNFQSQNPDHDLMVWAWSCLGKKDVIDRFDPEFELPGGFNFKGYDEVPCPVALPVMAYRYSRGFGEMSGAFLYHFSNPETGETFDAMVVWSPYNDDLNMTGVACFPKRFANLWFAFTKEALRISESAPPAMERVAILGGRSDSFDVTVSWDDIVLPDDLKKEIMRDVESFFAKGVSIYTSLKLKPFRKILFAGVPGTGKTMVCSALAKWALDNDSTVIYISGADKYGATFGKVQEALEIAASSQRKALVIVEELDSYLNNDQKSMILNVLDGSESPINPYGTLLIATTNYPESIDERVMKRPGRLDRIIIIPELESEVEIEKMLRIYLDEHWRDEHIEIVPMLKNRPASFIREAILHARTLAAYEEKDEITTDMLRRSIDTLKDQIERRDDFLRTRNQRPLGFGNTHRGAEEVASPSSPPKPFHIGGAAPR